MTGVGSERYKMTSTSVTDQQDINRNGEKSFELGLEGNRNCTSDIIQINLFLFFY